MSKEQKIRVGITHGDVNGIGYEVIFKAVADEAFTELCTPVIFGSSRVANHWRKTCGLEDVRYNVVDSAREARDGEVNLVNITSEEIKLDCGMPTEQSGKAAWLALDKCVEAFRNREIDVIVTAPINKEAMKMAGFPYPGHTEYFEHELGNDFKATMMLMCEAPQLRVALVTAHLPLEDVAKAVTAEAIVEKLRSLHNTLRKDFAVERPKIAVLSLNPHAGDGGALGNEEQTIITPAIEEACGRKIMAFGPYAADGFFGSGKYARFDAVLAMYHDQGLTPFKVLAMENGVNFTSGIPVVRTSPDHGTGYDIAGQGVADPGSMRQAIYSAIDILRRRLQYIRAKANPLKKQYVDRSGDREVLDLTKTDDTPDEILL